MTHANIFNEVSLTKLRKATKFDGQNCCQNRSVTKRTENMNSFYLKKKERKNKF